MRSDIVASLYANGAGLVRDLKRQRDFSENAAGS
jgi:hypothetical protein